MKKVNLPVAYGLMPIKDFNKIIGNILISNDRVVGYAISKCYIINEETTYNFDGTYSKKFRVIFPYGQVFLDEKTKDFLNEAEEYEYLSTTLEEVYDNFETAKEECRKKNILCLSNEKETRKEPSWNKYVKKLELKKKSIETEAKDIMSELEIKNV